MKDKVPILFFARNLTGDREEFRLSFNYMELDNIYLFSLRTLMEGQAFLVALKDEC
jgi:hypothetical protein